MWTHVVIPLSLGPRRRCLPPCAPVANVAAELPVGFKVSAPNRGGQTAGRPIYLDMQATTPMDPRVLDAMMPLFTEQYGNPHSRTHAYGWEAEDAVEKAREQVASLIGAGAKDIVFTSGATESNNLIIKGVANFHKSKKRHIITTQTVSGGPCLLEDAPLTHFRRSTSVSSTRAVSSLPRALR